jgi:hypothetical protein
MRDQEDLPRQAPDDELVEIVDRPGPWISVDGVSDTLRGALVRAAEISAAGRSPFKLKRPATNIEVDHLQMLRLWKRLGIVPAQ